MFFVLQILLFIYPEIRLKDFIGEKEIVLVDKDVTAITKINANPQFIYEVWLRKDVLIKFMENVKSFKVLKDEGKYKIIQYTVKFSVGPVAFSDDIVIFSSLEEAPQRITEVIISGTGEGSTREWIFMKIGENETLCFLKIRENFSTFPKIARLAFQKEEQLLAIPITTSLFIIRALKNAVYHMQKMKKDK